MNKRNILKSNREFNRIIRERNPITNKYYVIYVEQIEEENQLFGFSVGTKLGNAVERNKIRRQLKSIVQPLSYKGKFKCVIITKKPVINLNYKEKEENLIFLLRKSGILNYEE